jgi:CubicO group peptidase (beta-lactamase class C family)
LARWPRIPESRRSSEARMPSIPAFVRLAVLATFAFLGGEARPAYPQEQHPGLATARASEERVASDTPWKTFAGNTLVVPAGWTVRTQERETILEPPEGNSHVAIFDLEAATAEEALGLAWKAYKPDVHWPLFSTQSVPDYEGWTDCKNYFYRTSPNEKRDVYAAVCRAAGVWNITIGDLDEGVEEKRAAQINLIFGKFLPKDYERESFANRKARTLDPARVEELKRFMEKSLELTHVPGASLGLYQDGHVVFAGGFGVREMGQPGRPDGKTRYMVGSNTKALVTLLLARLVDEKRITWDTPVVAVFPSFKLGDATTTRKVEIKHLVCACTGIPRHDFELRFRSDELTPDKIMALLGTIQPTSGFGELFQYSNQMAAAAGYIAGHIVYPDMELGAAFDRAMQAYVFDPLGMRDTTMDFALAQRGNFAASHGLDVDGHVIVTRARPDFIVPQRPAGAVWSSVNDMLMYVAMELAGGRLPDGRRFIDEDVLLARRAPQVVVSTDVTYGMGLMVDRVYGTPIVHHGGSIMGFFSDMIWLPEHGVGAVVLTNGIPGSIISGNFKRKLLEVLFDGKPEADSDISAASQDFYKERAAARKLLTIPADPKAADMLAGRYFDAALGAIVVSRKHGRTVFDLGRLRSEVGSRVNPDGTVSFITTSPDLFGLQYLAGTSDGKRSLTLRDMQHEYILLEN